MLEYKVTPGFQNDEFGNKFSSCMLIKMVTSIIFHTNKNHNISKIPALSKKTSTKGTETEVPFSCLMLLVSMMPFERKSYFLS